MKRLICAAAGLCFGLCLIRIGAAQAVSQPQPPTQLCVNSKCLNTTPDVARAIKWNPGHYMAAGTVLYAGRTISSVQAEMDDLNGQDSILGYRLWITWGALEPQQGKYDFSTVDAVLARLKSSYNKPKRLVIGLWLYGQGALGSSDVRVMPAYIQQGTQYGNSPVAGSHGWWGKSAAGASTGMYAPALYNAAVMDRFIAMMQALGQHLDSDPMFEAVYIQEDATIAQAASGFTPVDPNYSDNAWLTQLQRLLTSASAAFPHTNVVMANSWFDRPASGVALEQWMASNRIAAGSADTWGLSSLQQYGTSHLSDGVQTLMGVDPYGGNTDLRGKMPVMVEVQSPDLAGNYFTKYGGPWTPQDLIAGFNQMYMASHVFWTHLVGSEIVNGGTVPAAAKWSNLASTCAANPLTHTGYPSSYP
jgi:hypothetical protein